MTYYQVGREITLGTFVVCTTEHGTYIGKVSKVRKATDEEMAKADFNSLFPPIDRIATQEDLLFEEESESREKEISEETQKHADKLGLGMKVLRSYLSIDEDKVLITFTSDARVDFRELVRTLNSIFHLKIELRQIGPRDQARLIGGIGPCGLPLCCSTFLDTFDGISIAMAKNQLLAINIPKLSGQCGKLMCCLKYEDKAYSEVRPLYPKIGEKVAYKTGTYEVVSLNLLTDTITLYNGDSYENFTKEEYERVKKGLTKTEASPVLQARDINSGVDLSGKGIQDTNRRIAQIKETNDRKKEENTRSNTFSSGRPTNNGSNNRRPGYSNSGSSRNSNNGRPNGNSRPNNYPSRPTGNPSSRPANAGGRPNNGGRPGNSYSNHNNGYHSYQSHSNAPKKESGFIPVSQITDKSVLNVKPVKKDDEKK